MEIPNIILEGLHVAACDPSRADGTGEGHLGYGCGVDDESGRTEVRETDRGI
ncbi:MAG: hypothetical protein JXA36_06675 [Coriobacteriia bacterium]|nr:hypothetical protein [Coriobacteriia bacterium]